MSIFKYLTLSHLQKVLAALEVRFTGVENEIEEINEINTNTSSRLSDIENNIPLPYDNLPNADFNNGAMGSSDLYARGDHRHPSDPSKANISDVLTKTNTTQYLPTNDYNPATKLYVDTKCNEPVVGTGTITISGTTASFTSLTPSQVTVYWSRKNPVYYYESLGQGTYNKRRYELISVVNDGGFYDFVFYGTDGSSNIYITTHIYSSNSDATGFDGTVHSYPAGVVQSDWNENDSSDGAYILNKPAIKAGTGENSVIIGDSEQLSNAAIYDITISGDANTTEYTYTTEATLTTTSKLNYTLFYSDKFYPLKDMTSSILTLFSSIGNAAISNADAKLYYKYKVASGTDSIAEGQGTIASGQRSHAEGSGSRATGSYSHAEGMSTISNTTGSHAEGIFTKSLGNATHAEGYGTEALVLYSHAEGNLSIANGQGSHSEGYKTKTNGNYAHTEGKYTNADGLGSHAEGYASTSIGYGSHAEGSYAVFNATLTGEANTLTYAVTNSTLRLRSVDRAKSLIVCVAGGEWNVESITLDNNGYLTSVTLENTIGASTSYPADIRVSSCANMYGSHAEGMGTFTNSNAAHSEGVATEALGEASHAEGNGTIAGSDYQHVQGKYNIEDINETYADIVGNGTSSARSNAYTLDWSGNGVYAGKLTVGTAPTNDMDVATKQYVDNSIINISSNDFIITVTPQSGSASGYTYSSDKTFDEIKTAYNSGKRCYAIYGSSSSFNVILPLCRVAPALVVFSGIATQSDSSDYLTYCIKINSSNEVTWKSIYLNGRNITTDKETIAPRNYDVSTTSFASTATQAYEIGDLFWRNYNVLAKATTAIASGDTLTENTNYVVTTIADELELKANIANVLTKTNTTSYTPTADYHPATKKYVDDATAGITTNLSGLTDTTISSPADGQLLKYNVTTSKWENVTLSLAINNNVIQLKEGNTVISSVTLPIYNGGVSS